MPKGLWKVPPRNLKIFTFWGESKTLTEPHSWFKTSNGHENFFGKPFGCFLHGPKNFRPPRTPNPHFRRPKFLNPRKMWKYQDFTQNGRKFQVCHLGVNTHSRPFSVIFPKTNDSGEKFFLKIFFVHPPLFRTPGSQNGENPDFRPKIDFGRNFGVPENGSSGCGVAENFSARTKKLQMRPQKNFHGANIILGCWSLLRVKKHWFSTKNRRFPNFVWSKMCLWGAPRTPKFFFELQIFSSVSKNFFGSLTQF